MIFEIITNVIKYVILFRPIKNTTLMCLVYLEKVVVWERAASNNWRNCKMRKRIITLDQYKIWEKVIIICFFYPRFLFNVLYSILFDIKKRQTTLTASKVCTPLPKNVAGYHGRISWVCHNTLYCFTSLYLMEVSQLSTSGSLRSENDLYNIDIYQGFIEKFSLFLVL